MNRAPVAVVIGAGDATGSAVARRFAKEGFTLCVTRRSVEKLSALVSDIEAAGESSNHLVVMRVSSKRWLSCLLILKKTLDRLK